MTERASYKFTVKESDDGSPWLMAEPMNDDLSVLRNGFLGVSLVEGSSYEHAQDVARFLNEHIRSLAFTPLHRA